MWQDRHKSKSKLVLTFFVNTKENISLQTRIFTLRHIHIFCMVLQWLELVVHVSHLTSVLTRARSRSHCPYCQDESPEQKATPSQTTTPVGGCQPKITQSCANH
eukprot:TRINITY_DN400_c0_g1_i1.p4 TRINITY_DN400_c0_g1~~TRINITY_DN400_c0_g1_i1.p4  ORF type:complete len:104 (+),score=7.10 TRINITY_DN400_c0_g1_i1:1604-1915(+)